MRFSLSFLAGPLQLVGKVVSAQQMQKTAKVSVTRFAPHQRTGKTLKSNKVYFAHDEKNELLPGDVVRIKNCPPISKKKRFTVVDIISLAERYTNPKTGQVTTPEMDVTTGGAAKTSKR
eukprot:m.84644 g.84644  ORF g.84644 m.84644 type:complete len:119 (+) comp25777_c1_seq1:151-507(+)